MLQLINEQIKFSGNVAPEDDCDQFKDLLESIVAETKRSIGEIWLKIYRQIKELQLNYEKHAKLLPLTGLDFEADVNQKIPKMQNYLEKRKSYRDKGPDDVSLQVKSFRRYYMEQKDAPTVTYFDQIHNEIECNLFLSDFENWIL